MAHGQASHDWQPRMDGGRHHRARLGFILMSTDLAAEADFADMAPEGVGVHVTRLKTEDYTTNETLARHLGQLADAAARLQPEMTPEVISYTYTGCDDDVPMTFYEIVGGGHTWPDSPLADQLADFGFFTDDISATVDGWAFMSQHSL